MTRLRRLRAHLLRTGRETAAAALQRLPEPARNALVARIAKVMPSPYHAGELEVQRRAGTLAQGARSGLGVGAELPRKGPALLARQRFLVAAARDARERPWVTMLEGAEGFLHAPDPLIFFIDAALPAADALADALSPPAELGLLAIDFDTKERLRIEGVCETGSAAGLRVRVRSALENCPQYLRRRSFEPVSREPGPTRALEALDEDARSRLAGTDVLFLGSGHPERGLDVSHKAGKRGFLRVDDARHLTLPDYAGNGMFQTLGNIRVDERVGLLVPDFEDGTLVQLTGRARVDWDESARADFRGAQRLTRIEVDAVRVHPGRLGFRVATNPEKG